MDAISWTYSSIIFLRISKENPLNVLNLVEINQFFLYCMSKKFWHLLCVELLYKMGPDFLDRQYYFGFTEPQTNIKPNNKFA